MSEMKEFIPFGEEYKQYSTINGQANPAATTHQQMQKLFNNWSDILQSLVAGVWQPNTAYKVGRIIITPNMGANLVAYCTGAGTSGAAEPTWPTLANGTVVDGGVTWRMHNWVIDSNYPLGIEKGGTGANTASQACANIGALPITGGTLTGLLQSNQEVTIKKSDNNTRLTIFGGNEWDSAHISLYGGDNESNPSEILLQSNVKGNQRNLIFGQSGNLIRTGSDLALATYDPVVYNSIVTSDFHGDRGINNNSCIRFDSGMQICVSLGACQIGNYTHTFEKPFISPPTVIICPNSAGIVYPGTISNTGVTGGGGNYYGYWIAIGRWK